MDEMTFFHKATVQICSSLDLNDALVNCFSILKQHIPLELIEISVFDQEIESIRILARHCEFDLSHNVDDPIPIKKKVVASIRSQTNRIFFLDSSDPAQPIHARSVSLGIDHLVGIGLLLSVKEKRLGMVAVMARGRRGFTQEHARWLLLLHDPFAVALSNHLSYREVLRLKELLRDDNRYLHQELHRISGDEIVGEDYGLKEVMDMVSQVAPIDSNTLLLGETGVGKEVIANAIHYMSPRRSGPLIKVNCGAIPEGLVDSELFGHEKGAFTGAAALRRGRFERANGGTLFLDEVAELPMAAQVSLLRVLQEKRIERVGGSTFVEVDVRIIAATHRNLEELVNGGHFRKDLWYRLNVFPINIPPLRDRKADIPAFVYHFIHRKARELNLSRLPTLSPEALERLQQYDWPGNVRELENVVEREMIRQHAGNEGGFLRFDHVAAPLPQPCSGSAETSKETDPRVATLDEMTRRYIQEVLTLTNGKVQGENGAAALLGVNPSTLRHRMRKLGIEFGRKGR